MALGISTVIYLLLFTVMAILSVRKRREFDLEQEMINEKKNKQKEIKKKKIKIHDAESDIKAADEGKFI